MGWVALDSKTSVGHARLLLLQGLIGSRPRHRQALRIQPTPIDRRNLAQQIAQDNPRPTAYAGNSP
jgi:hypothetical protein